MALFGQALLVSNTYSDSISVIDTATNKVMRTIDLGLPIKVPGHHKSAYGAGPNSIAVDAKTGVAYVALYNANAVAVVDLSGSTDEPVLGMIPVAYAPASVVLDAAEHELLVANDKGIGSRLFVRDRPWRDRPQHPPGQRHCQHRTGAEARRAGVDDETSV